MAVPKQAPKRRRRSHRPPKKISWAPTRPRAMADAAEDARSDSELGSDSSEHTRPCLVASGIGISHRGGGGAVRRVPYQQGEPAMLRRMQPSYARRDSARVRSAGHGHSKGAQGGFTPHAVGVGHGELRLHQRQLTFTRIGPSAHSRVLTGQARAFDHPGDAHLHIMGLVCGKRAS